MTDARQEYSLGGFGAKLKAAREAMNLSQKDAAMRLHLSPSILEILETEQFEKAPPATFLRGYFRSYARLLNFSEEEINSILTQSGLETKTSAPTVPVLQVENMQMTDRHVQRISTFVIVGLFVFTGIWWGFHSSTVKTNSLARSVPQQPAVAPVAQPQPITTPAPPVATNTNPAPAPTTAQPVAPSQPEVVQSTPAAPIVTTRTPTPTVPTTPVTPPAASVPAAPDTTTPTPQATPPALAGTPPTVMPGILSADPFATLPQQPDTTVANTNNETPKKRNRHHKQDSTVSGFAMALPEPGL